MAICRSRREVALCAIVLLGSGLMVYARGLRAGEGTNPQHAEGVGSGRSQASVSQTASQTELQIGHAIPERMHLEGLTNFAEITPNLYRGAQPSKQGFETLAKMGVTIVVDLRLTGREHERKEVTGLGMRFVEISWFCMTPHDADMADFLELIRENPGKKIFVHCVKGDDRTGMEIAAYRMVEQGWTEPEARKEMEAFGFGLVHQRLCTGLGRYETHFPKRLATSPAFQELRGSVNDVRESQPPRAN
jgi:tyrosine-protein phosphatase SIW14